MSSVPPPYGQQPTPPEEPSQYQPFQQYYEPPQAPPPQGQPAQRNRVLGWIASVLVAVFAFFKYAVVLFTKFAFMKTALTLLISFGVYGLWLGWPFAAGLVIMILIHEMGHVVEIRRQGMEASAPLFIPFFGAAIFQRSHPTDALKQAQIGIAGPLAGSVAATVAFVLYGSTHNTMLLSWAYIGFLINLFNLIPAGMLDGGWILAVVSKWFQVVGLAALAVAVVVFGFSPIVLIIVLLGLPAVIDRFRNDRSPYYQSVPIPARYAMGAAWLLLTAYLSFAFFQTDGLLQAIRQAAG